jgi:hypothetical protein
MRLALERITAKELRMRSHLYEINEINAQKPLNSSLRMRRKSVLGGGQHAVGARADCGGGTSHELSFVRNKCAKSLNSSLRMRRKPVLGGGRHEVGAGADGGRGTAHAQ